MKPKKRILTAMLLFVMLLQVISPVFATNNVDTSQPVESTTISEVDKTTETKTEQTGKTETKLVEPEKLTMVQAKALTAQATNLPSEADGTKIETINVSWITEDSKADNNPDQLNQTWTDNDSKYVRMKLNFALSGQHDYPEGTVNIEIPKYIFKDRNGKVTGNMTLAVPEATDKSGLFAYVDNGDTYILTNTKRLPSATLGMIETTIRNLTPSQIKDYATGYVTDNFNAKITVNTNSNTKIEKVSNNINAIIDTFAKISGAYKNGQKPRETWNTSFPDELKPSNPEKYVFVEYDVHAYSNSNQPSIVEIVDESSSEVLGPPIVLGYKNSKTGAVVKGNGTPTESPYALSKGYITESNRVVKQSGTQGGVTWTIYEGGELVFSPTNGVKGTFNNMSSSVTTRPWSAYEGQYSSVRFEPGVKGGSSLSYMFYNSQASSINLSRFDTSNVTNMSYMFASSLSISFDISLDLSSFDTSSVTDMSYMFRNSQATSLDLSNFDTSNVTNMSSMFQSSPATSLNLSNFDTSNVTDMYAMFNGSQATSLDLGPNFKWIGTNANLPSSTTGEYTGKWIREDKTYGPYTPGELYSAYNNNPTALAGTWVAEKVVQSGTHGGVTWTIYEDGELVFRPTNGVEGTFNNMSSSATTRPWSAYEGQYNSVRFKPGVKGGSSLSYMFSNSKATSLNLSNFDTSNVTSMSSMFYSSQATSLDLSNFDTSNVTNMTGMFWNSQATSLDLSNFDTSNVTTMSYMFNGSKATSLDLSNFDTSNVTNMSYMFYNSQETSIDLSSFDTSSVTNMRGMFNSSQATSLDLSSFDTSNVTDMSYMFRNSQATSLDLSNFDTSNVTNMSSMFYSSQATSLDLSNFDTSNVTNMSSMFYDSKATSIDLSNFDTSNVTDMRYMFWDSQATSLDLGPNFKWIGTNANLPSSTTGEYTGKWIREDKTYGPYTPGELYSAYNANPTALAGTWVAEKESGNVSITKQVLNYTEALKDKEYPVVVSLLDANGKPLEGEYELSSNVGLSTLVKHDSTINIKKDEILTINNLPVGTKVSVKENVPEGFNLLSQSVVNADATKKATAKLTLINEYNPVGSFRFEGNKSLYGADIKDFRFKFMVLKDGEVIQRVGNDESGKILFEDIALTYEDIGKTYTYEIFESNDKQDNIIYDEDVFTVKVTISDDGKGNIVATVDTPTIAFSNGYKMMPVTGTNKTLLAVSSLIGLLAIAVVVDRRKNKVVEEQ